VSLVDARGDCE